MDPTAAPPPCSKQIENTIGSVRQIAKRRRTSTVWQVVKKGIKAKFALRLVYCFANIWSLGLELGLGLGNATFLEKVFAPVFCSITLTTLTEASVDRSRFCFGF